MENKLKILNPNNIIYTKQYFRDWKYYVMYVIIGWFTEIKKKSVDFLMAMKNNLSEKYKNSRIGKKSKSKCKMYKII